MAERRFLLVSLTLSLVSCAEDDLEGSLARGECSPSGACAAGYECNPANECVPKSDAGKDAALDVESDAPCAKCASGFVCCKDQCANKNEDPANCGNCGVVCPGTLCQAGTCTNECQAGLANCNKNSVDGCEAPASACPADASTD